MLAVKRWEVLLTFMVRDMRRFLDQPNFETPLTEFFGGSSWRECAGGDDREQCLLLRFSRTVRERQIARFATPFRVFEDERRQTLYYLVHLTNEPLGMREMKKAMVKTSPEMTFWPVTVRPPAQLALDTAEQPPYPELQRHLLSAYGGRRMTFEELLISTIQAVSGWSRNTALPSRISTHVKPARASTATARRQRVAPQRAWS